MRIRTLQIAFAGLGVGLAVAAAGVAHGQSSAIFTQLSQLREPDFTAFAVAGNVVFVAQGTELVAVDMTNPGQPVQLSRRSLDSGTTASALLTNGQYLYARTGSRGLQIYRVANPRSMTYVGRFAPYDTYQPAAVALEGDRVYLGGTRFRIFDATNPTSPTQLANLSYVSSRMAINQGRALLTGGDTTPVRVYDVRDPANPAFLGELDHFDPSNPDYWHGEVAMQWPNLVVSVGKHWIGSSGGPPPWFPVDRYSQGFNRYRPGAGQSWDRLDQKTSDYKDRPLTNVAVAGDKVFVMDGDGVRGYEVNSLGLLGAWSFDTPTAPVGTVPKVFLDLTASGNRLWGLNSTGLASFDTGSTPVFSLRGTWDTVGGNAVALGYGRAYAFGSLRGVTTVDIRNPSAPRVVGKGPAISRGRAATVAGQYLYVADEDVGLRVLSLANPDQPQEVRVAKVTGGAMDVAISGGKAYVAGGRELLHIFNVTNPTSPVTMGVLPPSGFYTKAWAVGVAGNNVYLLATQDEETNWNYSYDSQLFVVDAHDPTSPRVIGSHMANQYAYHGGDLAIVGNSLLVTNDRPPGFPDFIPEAGPVFDISSPTSPKVVGSFTYGDRITLMAGNWALVAKGPHGLDAFMIANPPQIATAGFLASSAADVAASGKLAYSVSDSEGFAILKFQGQNLPDLQPRDFALTTTQVGPDQRLGFAGSIQNIGPRATTQSFSVSFAGIPTDRTGPPVNLCDWLQIPAGLAPGTTVSLAVPSRTLYGPNKGVLLGKYKVAVVADETNVIVEGQEVNNIALAAADLTVVPSANDLRPTEFHYTPDTVKEGQTITLSGRIEYTGIQPSAKGFWVEFRCSPNADASPPRRFLCDSLAVGAGLAPGTTYSFSITRTVYSPTQGLAPGLYVVLMIVDATNAVAEKSETNNNYWQSAERILVRDPRTDAHRWELYR